MAVATSTVPGLVRPILVVVLVALVAAACTSNPPVTAPPPTQSQSLSPSPTPAGPQTYAVSVDGTSPTLSLAADAFFPNQLSVHPGDTVNFTEGSSGELHTVTLGTLVDTSIVTPTAVNLAAVPSLLPAGRSDAEQSAAQACYLATGRPPTVAACPPIAQPAFNGTQAFYNSGWLSPGADYSVQFDPGTPPGTYYVRDLAHAGVSARIDVSPVTQPIASPGSVATTAAAQLQGLVNTLAPAVADAASLTTTVVTGQPEVAGLTVTGTANAFVASFFPGQITATVGQTISWTLYGQHALALNPAPGVGGLLTRSVDGSVHVNPVVANHTGGQAQPAGTPRVPVTINGGSYSGTAFHNSGLLTSKPPGLITYTLSFAARGTYVLHCLIHPAMTETIVVH